MRPTVKWLLPALAVSLTLAACGSSTKTEPPSQASAPASTTTNSASSSAIVKSAANSALGATVLTDAQGMTLYSLSGERAGKLICTSAACTQVWHPVTTSATGTPSGTVGSLATVKRPDGTEQVTYKGMPLYTFAEDLKPGDDKGQGIKDVGTWTAVTTSPASASSPASSAAGGEAASPPTPASESSSSGSAPSSGGYAY